MRITRPRATKISQITMDADLDLGVHTLKVNKVLESIEDVGITLGDTLHPSGVVLHPFIKYPWDISKFFYKRAYSIAGEETEPMGIFFKPDGTKMYIVGRQVDEVNEYDLSTAWDVTSAGFLQLFSVAGEETGPAGLFFKPDGLKMYIAGQEAGEINEYDLSTAWNISTATPLSLFDVTSEGLFPSGVFFTPDGTKMYVLERGVREVNEYDLSTAWDVTSAAFLRLFSVAGEDTEPTDIFFKPDGTKMYIVGSTGQDINEYDLSTAWDVTSAAFLQLFSVAGEETVPNGISFLPDGTKMYIVGSDGDDINEYAI